MKVSLHSSKNRAEQVKIYVEEQLAEAENQLAQVKLIRCGADRDLVQALKSVEEFQTKLTESEGKFTALWKSLKPILSVIRVPEDGGLSFGQFIPLLLGRFVDFIKCGFHNCVKNFLAHVRVLAPEVSLEPLAADSVTPEFQSLVEAAELEVEDLASRIVVQIAVEVPPPSP